MKTCKRCHTANPDNEFSKNARYRDGLWPYCKSCERARRAAYVAANLDKVKSQNARSIEKHKTAINARKRARRAANPEATKVERKRMYARHREKELTAMQAWKDANRDHMRAYASDRYWADPDAARARQNVYKAQAGKGRMWAMDRHVRKVSATPRWADRSAIQMMYDVAARVGRCLGIPHEVDHVVPLQGAVGRRRVVSGLHVEYNLRVVAMPLNRRKSNQFGRVCRHNGDILWPAR